MYRLISFTIILATMALIVHTNIPGISHYVSPALVLGFLMLSAYCTGYFLEKLKFPRITGFIFAGIILGPYVLKFYSKEIIVDLGFINSLALAFIAFCAGGELKISNIKARIKPILFLIMGVTIAVFFGVSLSIFAISDYIPFMQGYNMPVKLAIGAIFGVIAVARSPSSAIAIISETRAKGPYTDIVLTVTIVMDVVIIILFALVISVCQVMISSGTAFDSTFVMHLGFEIISAFVIGFFLGYGIIFLIEKVHVEFPVIIAAMGFIVIKSCHLMGEYLHAVHDISITVEPLLICMAAGFTVQNRSKHGETFLARMDDVSFPIYIAFFAITGASINIDVLKTGWIFGLIVVISRTIMIFIGSYLSGRLSNDSPLIYKNTWLGFITQAGVSLGLLSEVVRRFPEIGIPIQSILIASITLNQLIGPVAFKYALGRVGEIGAQRREHVLI